MHADNNIVVNRYNLKRAILQYLSLIHIYAGETRYCVRKIMPLQSDDTNFLQNLKAEIPAFLYFLTQRELSTTQESLSLIHIALRLFAGEGLFTDNLRCLVAGQRTIKLAGYQSRPL